MGRVSDPEQRRRIPTAAAIALVVVAAVVTLHAMAILPLVWRTVALSDAKPFEGFSYMASIPASYPSLAAPDVVLREDGRVVPLPNMPGWGSVAKVGAGRFHVQPGAIFFSTTDNSDPRTNGHTYAVTMPWPLPRVVVGVIWLAGLAGAVILAWRSRDVVWRLLTAPPFWVPATVLLVCVVANRAWFFLDFPMVAIHPDSGSYFAAAEMLGTSTWPNFGNRPPFYPVFLRAVFAVQDRAMAVAVAQTVLSFTATLLMVYACHAWRRALAIPAALALALFLFGFTTLEHDTAMLSESLYSSLLIIAFAALMLGLRRRNGRWLALTSICMALAIMTRPAGMFLVVVYVFVVLWLLWRRFPRLASAAFAVPLPALLVALSLYNMVIVRVFAPTTWGEANLAVATFLLWQTDPSYPPEINADVERIQGILTARLASQGKNANTLDATWHPQRLGQIFLEGFNQDALNVATAMGGHYETSARTWIRRVSFDAIRKRPVHYTKFVFTMLVHYFWPIPEYDFRVYLQNRAATFYVNHYFSPERGNDFLVRLGKEYAQGQPPPAVVITNPDLSVTMDQNDRVILQPTRAWRVYELTHRARRFFYQRLIWPVAVGVALLASTWVLVRSRFRHDAAFVLFIVTISAIGASLVVSLVEFSQPRYSYPMEWTYSVAMVLLPLLVLRDTAANP